MPEYFRIKSNRDETELRLRRHNRDSVHAELISPMVNASVDAYVLSPLDIVPFFDDLANHWRGWEGAKIWGSLEGQLKLACTRDKLGHLFLRVTLQDNLGAADWLAGATLELAAGDLEQLAAAAKSIFQR